MPLFTKKRLLLLCLLPAIFLTACSDNFDPVAYTRAILDLSFQGDIKEALAVEKEATPEELETSYYEFVSNFVEQNITADMQMEYVTQSKFVDLTMNIFSILRYNVKAGTKIDSDTYSVEVEVNPIDTFTQFEKYSQEDAKKIKAKKEAGGYEGTKEEVEAQVLADIYNHSYELLYTAYTETKYLEPVTLTLELHKKQEHQEIKQEDMNELIREIFCFN